MLFGFSPAAQTASSQNTFRQWPNEGSPEISIDVYDFDALEAGELIGIILEFRLRYELFQVPESRPEWLRNAIGRPSSFPVADLRNRDIPAVACGLREWTSSIHVCDSCSDTRYRPLSQKRHGNRSLLDAHRYLAVVLNFGKILGKRRPRTPVSFTRNPDVFASEDALSDGYGYVEVHRTVARQPA